MNEGDAPDTPAPSGPVIAPTGEVPATGGPRLFGKYELVRRIGFGASGSVYEASLPGALGFRKRVALKLFREDVVREDPTFVDAMVNEARIGGLLSHPNVVSIFEVDRHDGRFYMAMEYVDGGTLADALYVLAERGVLLPRFAVIGLGIQVCRGLRAAHRLRGSDGASLQLVHRDLKPANVLVDHDGTAKILDFGVAKAHAGSGETSTPAMVKGTPRFMAPEQITGEGQLTRRADLFSFGAILYEMITGRPLFDETSVAALASRIVFGEIGREMALAERLMPGCAPLLTRLLAKRPRHRPSGAREVAGALRSLAPRYPAEVDPAELFARLGVALDSRRDERMARAAAGDHGPAGGVGRPSVSLPALRPPPDDPVAASWARFRSAFPRPAGWMSAEQSGQGTTSQVFLAVEGVELDSTHSANWPPTLSQDDDSLDESSLDEADWEERSFSRSPDPEHGLDDEASMSLDTTQRRAHAPVAPLPDRASAAGRAAVEPHRPATADRAAVDRAAVEPHRPTTADHVAAVPEPAPASPAWIAFAALGAVVVLVGIVVFAVATALGKL